MSKSFCFDHAVLGKAKITAEGFLKAPVTISRTGVANYGYAKKAKLPEELLSDLTLDSIRGLPITDEHPQENDNYVYVTPENSKKFAKGNVSEPYIEGDSIKALITIWDKDLVNDVVSGKREVSFGYSKEDEVSKGEFDGNEYDIVQRQIIGNHLAITSSGRIPGATIEIDSNGQIIKDKINGANNMSVKFMKIEDGKIVENRELKTYNKIDGKDIAVDSELHTELIAGRNLAKDSAVEVDSLKKEIEEIKKKKSPENDSDKTIESLKLENDVSIAKVKTLEKNIVDQKAEFDSNLDKMVTDRISIKENAEALEIDTKGKSTIEIKKEIIGKSMEVDVDKLEDIQIDAFYLASLSLKKEIANKEDKGSENSESLDLDSIEKIRAKRNKDLAEMNETK